MVNGSGNSSSAILASIVLERTKRYLEQSVQAEMKTLRTRGRSLNNGGHNYVKGSINSLSSRKKGVKYSELVVALVVFYRIPHRNCTRGKAHHNSLLLGPLSVALVLHYYLGFALQPWPGAPHQF
nr:hypothetical protein Iba_chr11bCG4180 [Ipomoea batatas]GMD53562.1 hypothetical protein Iba_chr11cCG3810 [Ipomoea batatas]